MAQRVVGQLATLGEHFTLRPEPGRPLDELHDPGHLSALVTRVSERLGNCEVRVAASIVFLGITARLWAVALGSAVLTGQTLDLDEIGWSDDNGSVALHLPAPRVANGDLDQLIWDGVILRHTEGLVEVVHDNYPLPKGLLWGNVASGLWGAARVVARPAAEAIALRLLAREPLKDTMQNQSGRLRRRSCCLFWRVPGGGVCGDCLFDVPPG